jgi:hypothetical protein
MRIFLAGIMQGSHVAALVHDQTYRDTLRELLQSRWPQAAVYDPFAGHGNSIGYDLRRASEVFHRHVGMCREADLVVAYIPEASMGTAIEVWEACQHGRAVVTITPLDGKGSNPVMEGLGWIFAAGLVLPVSACLNSSETTLPTPTCFWRAISLAALRTSNSISRVVRMRGSVM